jgi:hypothetical protein
MVTKLKVPDEQAPTLKTLVALGESEKSRLLTAIRQAEPKLRRRELSEEVARGSGLPETDVASMLRVLGSLWISMDAYGEKPEPFSRAIVDAIKDAGIAARELNLETFRKWIQDVLALDSPLGASAKASSIANADDFRFCRARVITEFRPVFSSDPTTGPVAGVIIHHARFTYHHGEEDEHEAFSLSMDRDDIEQLQKTLESALVKEESLKVSIAKGGIPILGR